MHQDARNLEFVRQLRMLRRRAPLVLVCLVVTTAAAFLVSNQQRAQYTASASILFREAQLDQQAAGLPVVVSPSAQSVIDTNLRLASLPRLAAETPAMVGHGVTAAMVADAVSVTQEADTNLATVSATASSPSLAAAIANAYANRVITDRREADQQYYDDALRAVTLQFRSLSSHERASVQGTSLKDRAASLQILKQLQGTNAQIAQAATVPGAPSSPRVTRNTLLGGVLGLLCGVGFAFALERFDRRLREPGDLEAIFGAPLVGVVHESSSLGRPDVAMGPRVLALPPREAETFGLLRAQIRYFNVDQEMRVVLVVSASPGDGKTTIAGNLAMAAATSGSRVLFLEADFRRPAAARQFGTRAEPGVAGILVGDLAIGDAVQTIEFEAGGGKQLTLDVLVAGATLTTNPAQVIESKAMATLLEHTRSTYDLVVVDTPPLAVLSDAFPLLRLADGVLIVSRLGHNRRDVAARLHETLANAEARVIGVVANGYRESGLSSPYSYGYGQTYGDAERSGGADPGEAREMDVVMAAGPPADVPSQN